ncbi:hypothetical protein [Rhizobium oryzicola]|uniref:Succinoglycan biosynthesis transport protein n=1 Tax=Rhizobium oryzicola TaxID=1232668 RepID=A0ABT8STI2_9HYPH|nr:hypothetical protein [Rhizobium oryzicola]MDO1581047.1 hypothetical protein [Rhizobium oryzicola]
MDVSNLPQAYSGRLAVPSAGQEGLRATLSSAHLAIVIMCGLFGAALPLVFPADMFESYTAETRLEVRAEASAKANRQAIMTAAAGKVRDADHLDRIIHAMDLGSDPEFASATPTTWRFVSELFSRREMTVKAAEQELRERVSGRIDIVPGNTGLAVRGRSTNSITAARIANLVAEELQDEIAQTSARQESDAVAKARVALETSQSALDADGADEGALAAMRRAEAERRVLDEEKARLDQRSASLADQMTAISGLKIADVIAKGLPDTLNGSSLDLARRKRADAKLQLDQMSVDLGPRHPRFIAAKAALDDADAGIERTMKALTASLKQQEAALSQEKQALDAKLASLEAKPVSEAMRKRAQLEAAVDTARKTYLEALRREEAAGQTPVISSTVIAPARAQAAVARGYPFWAYSLWAGLVCSLGAFFLLMLKTRSVPCVSVSHARTEPQPVSQPKPVALPKLSQTSPHQLPPVELPAMKQASQSLRREPSARVPAPAKPLAARPAAAPVLTPPISRPIEKMEQRVMANDLPLTEQIKKVLMENRQQADALAAPLPSLVAGILNRDLVPASQLENDWETTHDAAPAGVDPEELRDLHEELQRLRRELSHYGSQDRAA